MPKRTCIDCSNPITRQSKTGRCQPCATRFTNADPANCMRRKAALAAYFDTPGAREKCGQRMAHYNRNLPPDHRERRRLRGRRLARDVLALPENKAKAQDPEVRARATARAIETKLGWCPPERREEYRRLCASLRLSAADARRMILDDERVKRNAARAAASVPLTFEEKLARVAAGAKLVPTFKYRRPDPEMTLGGVAPEAI